MNLYQELVTKNPPVFRTNIIYYQFELNPSRLWRVVSLPLSGGDDSAGQTSDDVVFEHELLQASLAVSVVAFQDLETIRIINQRSLFLGMAANLGCPLFVVVGQQAGIARVHFPCGHLQSFKPSLPLLATLKHNKKSDNVSLGWPGLCSKFYPFIT